MTHFELALKIVALLHAEAPCGIVGMESDVGGKESLVRLRLRARGELREISVRIDARWLINANDADLAAQSYALCMIRELRREIERGDGP